MNKPTYEEVKEYIKKNGCVLLTDHYKNKTQKLEIQCSCGKIFTKTLKAILLKGHCKCRSCINTHTTKTFDEVKKNVECAKFKLLTEQTEFVSTKTKLYVECTEGHKTYKNYNDILKGTYCKICRGRKISKMQSSSYIDVKNEFKKYGYELLEEECNYIKSTAPLKVICKQGHISNMILGNVRKGCGCMECYNENRGVASIVPYEDRYNMIKSYGYTLITPKSEYVNGDTSVDIMCENKHIYTTTIHRFKMGYRCTECQDSKGSRRVKTFLNKYKIRYITEYRFSDCKFKRTLPFDFYLPNYNICIEYDGRQHYEIVKAFGGMDAFIDTKIRDTIKNKYCENNNIKLIRIPYWEFDNIENILIKEFKL